MPLLAAPGVFARSPDVGSTIDKLVNSSLPVVAERGAVCTGRVRAMLAMLAILPQTVGSRVHFVECPSTAQIGTRVVAPEPAGSWSLSAAACGSDSPSRDLKIRNPGEVLGSWEAVREPFILCTALSQCVNHGRWVVASAENPRRS